MVFEGLLAGAEHLALHEEVLPRLFSELVAAVLDYGALKDVLRRSLFGLLAAVAGARDLDWPQHHVLRTAFGVGFVQYFGKE